MMSKKPAYIIGVMCLLFLIPQSLIASHIEVSEQQLIRKAEIILAGKVVAETSYWNPEMSKIYTDFIVQVERAIKGKKVQDKVVVKISGGKVGDIGLSVTDQPHFEIGEHVLLYLKDGGQGKMKVIFGSQGKYAVVNEIIRPTGENLDSYVRRVSNTISK